MNEATRPNPYPLRLTHELSRWVKEQAKSGDRSMNAEINRMLKKMKEAEEKQAT